MADSQRVDELINRYAEMSAEDQKAFDKRYRSFKGFQKFTRQAMKEVNQSRSEGKTKEIKGKNPPK